MSSFSTARRPPARRGTLSMDSLDHRRQAVDLAHEDARERDEVNRQVAQRAEARHPSRARRHDQGNAGSAI